MKNKNKTKKQLISELNELREKLNGYNLPKSADFSESVLGENLFTEIYNTLPCGIIQFEILNKNEHKINFINNTAKEILGIKQAHLETDNLTNLLQLKTDENFNNLFRKPSKNEKPFEREIVLENGSKNKYIKMKCNFIKTVNKNLIWNCVFIDNTEQIEAENKNDHLKRVLMAIRDVNQLITKEKNKKKLIMRACEILVEANGYFNAWIAIIDESGNYVTASHCGENNFSGLNNLLKQNAMPECAKKALNKKTLIITENPEKECKKCTFNMNYRKRGAFTIGLFHCEKLYGVLSVSVPVIYIFDKDEHALFSEVAGDIAYALYSIEESEKREIAEKRLSISEQRFRKLFENSPDGVFMHDLRGNFLDVNDKFVQMFGYAKGEILTKTVFDFHPPSLDALETGRKAFDQLLEKGSVRFETEFQKKNKDVFIGTINTTLAEINKRKIVIGSIRDTTERRLAEKKVEKLETTFRKLYENIPSGTLIIGMDYRITDVNERTCDITGYSKDELIGQICDILCPKGSKAKLCPIWEQGNKSFEAMETYIKCKDGTKTPILKNAVRVQIHSDEYIIENFQDISHIKNIEWEIEQLYYRRRLAMEVAAISWWEMYLPSGKINFDSNKATILGYEPDDFSHYEDFTSLVHPDDYKKVMNALREHLNGKKKKYDVEYRIKTKSGNYKWFHDVGGITKKGNNNGETLVTGIVIDITDMKFQEKKLKEQSLVNQKLAEEYSELNKELEENISRIKEMNLELKHSKEKAEESDNLKSAFLANMCHEIRTPMSGILGFAELLKNPDLSANEEKEFIKIIEQSGQRMLNIINDLINISLIDAGQVDLNFSSININDVMDSIYYFFKPEANMRGLDLKYKKRLTQDDAEIETDETKLNQVLTNLIKNALKFTREGKIEFGYTHKNGLLEFYVKDTGIGVRDDIKETIFDRFRQGDLTIARPYEGTGLGLSISKTYVEILGGEIRFEDNPSGGTIFYFTLPYHKNGDNMEKERTPCKNVENFNKSNFKVLVAEDDLINYKYLEKLLNIYGIKPIHAKNGIEAVNAVENHPDIKLVFMDIKMPKMNGYEATEKIKKTYPHIPVVVQTAYAMAEDKEKALQAGCNDFITKPTNKTRIQNVLLKYLENIDK